MGYNNDLLIRKIKEDPLDKKYIESFLKNSLEKIVFKEFPPNQKFVAGETTILGIEDTGWPYFSAFSFDSSLIPNLQFIIQIDPRKNNTLSKMGHVLIHEIAHTKYHLWAVLDELRRSKPNGDWHELIDDEAKRFVSENKNFVYFLTESLFKDYQNS